MDDYREAADILAIYLQGLGFAVQVSTDSEAAFTAITQTPPDLIVMDLEMPVLSGFDVARRLRMQTHTRRIPLIAATGYSQLSKHEAALAAGFDIVLVKPYDPDELVREIRRLLVQSPSPSDSSPL